MTTLLFVHGACVRDGAWWWSRMVDPLAAHGIDTAAVALPSCGESDAPELGDLRDDVGSCLAAIDAVDGPVTLLGHSYGGMVITEAGAHDRVEGLVYVTSVMPEAGQTQGDVVGDGPAPWLDPSDDGTIGVHERLVRELFLQDCDEAATEGAVERLTRQSLVPFTQAPREVAWERKPSTYVVCTQDLATPADEQRRRVRPQARAVDVDAGHHPFLSRPEDLAGILAGAMGSSS